MCNFPSGNFPSVNFPNLPIAACGASEGLKPKLGKLILAKLHILEVALGKMPNKVKNRLQSVPK